MTTVIIWILSLCAFCYVITRSTTGQDIDIDFDDYKEKELGDIEIFKDEAEFNDYKEF